jgi:hypothetical protein
MSIRFRLKREKEGRILKCENWGRKKKSNFRSIERYKWRYVNVKRIRIRRSLLRITSKI